ncbi:hypothetical protein B484DRAFT_411159 [Ochromonadaceae sp. CCMP2298]|nr:hypothetical protein B484DRAFT_411159 [Ochromonadaceae sp. CCMP2298]
MSIKLTPINAKFATAYLVGLPVQELPSTWEYGTLGPKFATLAHAMISNEDCTFQAAKSSTVIGWTKTFFGGVDSVLTHIQEIASTGQQLNLDEPETAITINGGSSSDSGSCTSLDLIAAEFDVQKVLGISFPAAPSKAMHAIAANNMKNTVAIKQILLNLLSLAKRVSTHRAKVAAKAKKGREKDLGKIDAAARLLHQQQDGDKDGEGGEEGDTDEDEEKEEGKGKKGKVKGKQRKSKKRKIEGPALGQGQTSAEGGGGGLRDMFERLIAQNAAPDPAPGPGPFVSPAADVLSGSADEVAAWKAINDPEAYIIPSSHARTVAMLKKEGAKEPTHLKDVGKTLLEAIAMTMLKIPGKIVRRLKEQSSQE